jgi:hypothetical protein
VVTIAAGILLAIVLLYLFLGLSAGTIGGFAVMKESKGCGCMMVAVFGGLL